MRSSNTDSVEAMTRAMIEGHHRFLGHNTGTTNDDKTDLYVLNPEGLLANNRHFIAETRMEYQPNGDGTTEGQVIHVLGYIYAYRATGDQRYLDAAEFHWDAYVQYFYAGQPIPETPQRWICNWILNAKAPVLANWPINSTSPTNGGYKCVPLQFVNGEAQIPHGSPFWGEYLDVCTFAHRGHMSWNAINGGVQPIVETIDWDLVYSTHRVTTMPTDPTDPQAWIDWQAYLGPDGYTVDWAADRLPEYGIDTMIAWTGDMIDANGDVVSSGHLPADVGKIKLQDTSINGVYLFNYAVRLPVEHGGYLIGRNEVQHNRPIHTPLLGSVNQMGNAADAEVWMVDACYQLYQLTGNSKYANALDAVLFTSHEYTDIDSKDAFFRKSKFSTTPYTDGISYNYTYPSQTPIEFSRDSEGYIVARVTADAQHTLEQQAIRYRITRDSKCRVQVAGLADDASPVSATVELEIDITKRGTNAKVWQVKLPNMTSLTVTEHDVPLSSFVRRSKDNGDDYIVADNRAATDYGGCTWSEDYEQDVLDGRSAAVLNATLPDDNAGFIYGFWLLDTSRADINKLTYRSDAVLELRIEDDNGWRWHWLLANTNDQWITRQLYRPNLILNTYQPNHADTVPRPSAPVYTDLPQFSVVIPDEAVTNAHFGLYCVNDIPPTFDQFDGYTQYFRLTTNGTAAYTAKIGDCKIIDYRQDSLAYCPGVTPFSNIYEEGSEAIGAWHGMPYPGYQSPMIYLLGFSDTDATKFNNAVQFLYDSQQAYYQEYGILGPGAAAYVWDRWDNYAYGDPDTWTKYHWGDGKPWPGYQARAFSWACRAWQEQVEQGENPHPLLESYCENWIRWLVKFVRGETEDGLGGTTGITGILPTDFPLEGPPLPLANDFTGHMTGLWLSGACMAYMAGCRIEGIEHLIETCVSELHREYTVTATPGHPMNGCWSPWASPNDNEGMFFGFWAGEILKGLGIYLLYRKVKSSDFTRPPVIINENVIVIG